MKKLYTTDAAFTGVYRAFVVQALSNGECRIFIPSMQHKLMPFKDPSNPQGGVIEGCETRYTKANSSWWSARTELKVGDAVWVMFENGNVEFPIIVGQFAANVPVAGEGSGTSGGTQSVISTPTDANYGDSAVVDRSGELKENGTISNVQYLILHTSCTRSIDTLISVLQGRDLGVQAAVDNNYIYKLCSNWDSILYHCGGLNSKAVGCEMIESEHIKWNSNCTAVNETHLQNNLDSAIAWHTKCYNNAVNLFAYWCNIFGLDETRIYSHKEAKQVGSSSDHADPEELWDVFKKLTGDNKWTMNAFRAAVKARIPEVKNVQDTSTET